MGSEAKNSAERTVKVPGYHVTPKYDLPFLRARVQNNDERDFDVVLPLASMIDMYSVLVMFLLTNFSATGEAYFVDKHLKLPVAHHARTLESLPLISISKDKVSLDSEVVGINPVVVDLKDMEMPLLENELKKIQKKRDEIKSIKAKDDPMKNGINLQAGENTDVIYIKRVMNVLISNGFQNINFVTRSEEGNDNK